MKQKSSRVLTEKTENASSGNAQAQRGKRILPEGAFRKRFEGGKEERLTGGPHVRFKHRRRPKAAVVAGVEPRRGREIGGYQEFQGVLPRRWVVDLVVGEHHVDDDTFSGGRWFGRWWRTPVGAANSELKHGSGEWMHKEATGKS